MKSEYRFIFLIFVSPLVGALYFLSWAKLVVGGPDGSLVPISNNFPLPIVAWIFCAPILMSLFFAVAMDVAFDLGLRPGSWGTVLLAEILGLVAGAFVGLFKMHPAHFFDQNFTFETMGLATGFTMGLAIKIFFSTPVLKIRPLD